MTNKSYKIKINGLEDYIEFFNGIFNLSPTEIEILAEFIIIDKNLKANNIDINPFSTDMKKKVAIKLGRDNFNTLNNYIKSLCDKGAIKSISNGYQINNMLIPTDSKQELVTFKLEDNE